MKYVYLLSPGVTFFSFVKYINKDYNYFWIWVLYTLNTPKKRHISRNSRTQVSKYGYKYNLNKINLRKQSTSLGTKELHTDKTQHSEKTDTRENIRDETDKNR